MRRPAALVELWAYETPPPPPSSLCQSGFHLSIRRNWRLGLGPCCTVELLNVENGERASIILGSVDRRGGEWANRGIYVQQPHCRDSAFVAHCRDRGEVYWGVTQDICTLATASSREKRHRFLLCLPEPFYERLLYFTYVSVVKVVPAVTVQTPLVL